MIIIRQSVGEKGGNLRQDVLIVQKALNKVMPSLAAKPLLEDGLYGKNTGNAIMIFQKKYVMLINPDGRIDPVGRTIRKLTRMQIMDKPQQKLIFPLSFKPAESYKSGMRAFGANRSNGRKHAGIDLYAAKSTPIRAMKDGKVIHDYKFYLGTRALEIDHEDMVVRYGEISHVVPGIIAGTNVRRGQIIAYVGELIFKSGNKMSMLHLEAYKGTLTGPLTVRGATPYQRRSDLFDPTKLLDDAAMN